MQSSQQSGFEMPSYFYNGENKFERMKQNPSDPREPRAFHMTQPEDWIRKQLFET